MARILAIGIATLDIINEVDTYPAEDAEVRARSQRLARGGNATNSLVVLSRLGHQCSWGGVWVDEPDVAHIRADLERYGIDTAPSRLLPTGKVPTSYISLSRANGSRTIVHYRDLPEFSAEDFGAIDLADFDWLHFEGRNVADTALMLRHALQVAPHIPRSLEVEKPRSGIEALFGDAQVLLFSPDYARHQGCSPEQLLHGLRAQHSHADLYCTAGAAGAEALDRSGRFHRSRAFAPPRVVDTLGAGDAFNAAVIDGYLHKLEVGVLLGRACRIAGAKVGGQGFDHLATADFAVEGQ